PRIWPEKVSGLLFFNESADKPPMQDCARGKHVRPRWALPIVALLATFVAHAQTPNSDDLTALSLEDLTQVKVYSASRHLEGSREAPSVVSIISSKEISQYGWRTLADALRSLRGFYTAYDRNYSYLGVRGFLRSGDYNT